MAKADGMMRDDHTHAIKAAADTVSAAFALGTLLNWLPSIAALLSIIWYGIRIGEYIAAKLKQRKDNGKG